MSFPDFYVPLEKIREPLLQLGELISGGDTILYDAPYASLSAAVTAIGSDLVTLVISRASFPSGANTTVPPTLTLWFTGAGTLNNSHTVTINGPIIAPARQIFSGSGTLDLSGADIPYASVTWWGVDLTGATDSSAAVQKAIDSLVLRLHLPAGTYLWGQARITSTARVVDFSTGHDNLEIFGDGIGKTIITVPNGVTYRSGGNDIFNLNGGTHQSLHDLTLQGPASYVSGQINVIASSGGIRPHIYNFEITGWSGDGSAGAACVTLFRSASDYDVDTELGTTIVAGTRTVTPDSMEGIYYGRRLRVHGLTAGTIIGGVDRKYYFKGNIMGIAKYDNALSSGVVSSVSTALASLGASWWTSGGASGLMFAYQPKGAASYAASKTDLSAAGNNASDGSDIPIWDSTNGWTFSGGQTLLSNAAANQKPFTVIVRFKTTTTPPDFASVYSFVGSLDGGMQFCIDENDELVLAKSDIERIADSTSSISLSTDTVAAVTYDGSGNYAFYIGGSAVGTGTNNQTFDADAYETVVVTDITATEFTAVFANAHDDNDRVTGLANGYQGAIVENFNIHDNPLATGIVENSTGNLITKGEIIKCGLTDLQHGLYIQAGFNTHRSLKIKGISGYSIHKYPGFSGVVDSSGDIYDDIYSENAGVVHCLISGETADFGHGGEVSIGTNPNLPQDLGLSRYTRITNCTFKNTHPGTPAGSLHLLGPVYFDGNVLEDIPAIVNGSAYSIYTPNNVSRKIFSTGAIARIPVNMGGGVKMMDAPPDMRQVVGQSAYPQAVTNVTGGNVDLMGGWGVRAFTALDNLAGAVTLTVDINPTAFYFPITLVSGVDFDLGTDNTLTQLHQTALNIAEALYNANSYQFAAMRVVGPTVYFERNPSGDAGTSPYIGAADLLLTTNQSGRISVTSHNNGKVKLWGAPELVTDDAYHATNWNSSLGIPTKNALRDIIETLALDSAVVHDTGDETIAGVKTFSSDPLIPDEAYGAGWNGSLEPPTKNAVYDKLETGYTSYSPTWTNLSVGNGVVTAEYFQIGKTVFVRIALVFGNTTSVSGAIRFSLPVTAITYPGVATGTSWGKANMVETGVALYLGHVTNVNTTTAEIRRYLVSGTNLIQAVTSATAPFTWGDTDQIIATFSYQAA